jgi:hypothetical protein
MTKRQDGGPPVPRAASSHFVRNFEYSAGTVARLLKERDQRAIAYHAAAAENPNVAVLGDPVVERSALHRKREPESRRRRDCHSHIAEGIARFG